MEPIEIRAHRKSSAVGARNRKTRRGESGNPRVRSVMNHVKDEHLSIEELLELMHHITAHTALLHRAELEQTNPYAEFSHQSDRGNSHRSPVRVSFNPADDYQDDEDQSVEGDEGEDDKPRRKTYKEKRRAGGRTNQAQQAQLLEIQNTQHFDGPFPLGLSEVRELFDTMGPVTEEPERDTRLTLVSSPSELLRACEEITRHRIIAVDCEGVRLSRTGKLCILQLATLTDIYVVDITAITSHKPLEWVTEQLTFLEDRLVLKLVFDCRGDSDALYHQLGVRMLSVLDWQLMDIACRRTADAVLQATQYRPSLIAVMRSRLPESVRATSRVEELHEIVQKEFVKDVEFWGGKRPLGDDFVEYAALGVRYSLWLTQVMWAALTEKWRKKVLRRSEVAVHEWRELDEELDRKERGNAKAPKL